MRGCDYINLLSCRVLSFAFLKFFFRELSTRPLPAFVLRDTAVGETSFKIPFLSEGYRLPFFITRAQLEFAPPKTALSLIFGT
jgi:hypothetical protein